MKTLRYASGVLTLALGCLGAVLLWNLLDPNEDEGALRFTLLFQDSEGLNLGAGIRYRGVTVGEVTAIELAPGGQAARVECRLRSRYRDSLSTTTRFWVVRPRFEGLTEGVSGLETLLKDSYVTYLTPSGARDALPDRAIVQGLEVPPAAAAGTRDAAPTQAGDLEFTVLFEESTGLHVGAPVRCRGIRVGQVLAVKLHPSEQAVEVRARVSKARRRGITDGTRFWIARPNLSAGLWKGVDVDDLDTLVGGAHLAYVTPSSASERGSPAQDGALFVGSDSRPDTNWQPPTSGAPTPLDPAPDPGILNGSFVSVSYSFLEIDWLSPDDAGYRVSPGILFTSRDDRALVVVARSGIDGTWIAVDGTGDPEIGNELWRVTLSDGSVFGAKPVWIDPSGSDLALLALDGEPPRSAPPMSMTHRSSAPIEVVDLVDGQRRHLRGTLDAEDQVSGIDSSSERGLVLQEGRAIGIVGELRKDGEKQEGPVQWFSFALIPVALQPVPVVDGEQRR